MANATPGKKATSRSAKKRFAFRTCASANQKPAANVKPKKRPPNSGSSFLACCIANALIDKQVRASVTNFPRILNKLQGFDEDKQEFLDKLSRYDLLVIDDLGVERDTSYSVEQVFNVIDARSRTGKPLIVTTNLSLADLQNPSSLGYARIYDRILEMCPIRLKLAGDSRRTQNAQERRDKAKRLLGLERT